MAKWVGWQRRLGMVGAVGLAALAVTLSTTEGCASFGALTLGNHTNAALHSPQHRGGKFENATPTHVMNFSQTLGVLGEYLNGRSDRSPKHALPLYPNTAAELAVLPSTSLRVTWFGHSSVLLELDGVRILTDPQWSDRASPLSVAGPRRFHPPVLPLNQLGHLDAVLISHDHYDHLDMATVQALGKAGVKFMVGLGVGAHLERWGVAAAQIQELDWWQEQALVGGVKVVSTPGRHFSGRLIPQGNPTLWTSFCVVGPNHRVFFSGDTGMGPHLREIGQKVGPFDVTMLEIGQFHPAWRDIHLGAQGALDAHTALRGTRMLPIHWATFELALHGWSQPAQEVLDLSAAQGVQLLTPMLGQPVEPTLWATPALPWWHGLN